MEKSPGIVITAIDMSCNRSRIPRTILSIPNRSTENVFLHGPVSFKHQLPVNVSEGMNAFLSLLRILPATIVGQAFPCSEAKYDNQNGMGALGDSFFHGIIHLI